MCFDDNSNFVFTVDRLKTLSFDKEYYNALVTVSEIHNQAALTTVVLSPCNDGTYCPVLRACAQLGGGRRTTTI